MKPPRLATLAALTTLVLAACGGGGDDSAAPAPTPSPDTPTATLAAVGSSSHTAALQWTASSDEPVTVERQGAGGDWLPLAQLPAGVHEYQDSGLTPQTTYHYRVRSADGRVLASAETQTDDIDPLVTAIAPSGDELARATVGTAGGRVELADGSMLLDVDAGTFDADTEIRVARIANTAPDGVDDGLRIGLAQRPAKPLKLTLRYGDALSGDGGGLRVAVQQGDGTWLALPTAHDADTRSLATTLAPPPVTAQAHAQGARMHANDLTWVPHVEYSTVKYRDLYLSPRSATVRIGETQQLVPYAHTTLVEECVAGGTREEGLVCLPLTVRESREVPLLNQKDGYERQWLVEDVVGGNNALGQVTPRSGAAGATYTAPARAPNPNPVTVTFRSKDLKSGRTADLKARIQVQEPHWTGLVHGVMPGAVDLGFSTQAQGVWALTSDPTVEQYEVTGTQTLNIENITCTATASPGTVALPPGLLKIDRSTQPATYQLDIGSLWNTTITGTCPGEPGTAHVPMTVPGQLQVQGQVSADGKLIQGRAVMGGIEWDWSFALDL